MQREILEGWRRVKDAGETKTQLDKFDFMVDMFCFIALTIQLKLIHIILRAIL